MTDSCEPGAHQKQKRVSDPLDLELQMVSVTIGGLESNLSPLQKQKALQEQVCVLED